jgi:hypothetical protein
MRSSNRWLFAFGIAIGVLVIVAVVLVLTITGEEAVTLLPEDTPEGTVQRYFLAIEAEDYEKAYSYLSPSAIEEGKPHNSYEDWSQTLLMRQRTSAWKATLGESSVTDDRATVAVTIDVFKPDTPFENPVHSRHYTFQLKKEGNSWSITAPLYPVYLN